MGEGWVRLIVRNYAVTRQMRIKRVINLDSYIFDWLIGAGLSFCLVNLMGIGQLVSKSCAWAANIFWVDYGLKKKKKKAWWHQKIGVILEGCFGVR